MFRAFLATVLLAAFAAGCSSPAPASGPADTPRPPRHQAPADTLRLGVGEGLAISGGHTLTFIGVVEDSRCPEDVECVRAGTASVQVEADGETVVLTLPGPEAGETSTVHWAGVDFEASALTPYPGSEADRRGAPVVLVLAPRR